jgi:tripartite-type tricarboxylate transporter receptor subunit TctC
MIFRKFRNGKGLWFNYLGLTLLSISFIISFLGVSSAVDYPTKPIQLITGFPAGGGNDTVARIVVTKLSPLLGQPIVVVNKTGGGGVIGTYAAKAAPPDGYTIFIASPPMLRHPLTTKGVSYDLVRDFIPINLSVSVNSTPTYYLD